MKYLSLDIETTGLDREKSDILEVGFVMDDTSKPLEQANRGRILIMHPTFRTDLFCANMHRELIEEMALLEKPFKEAMRSNDPSIRVLSDDYCLSEAGCTPSFVICHDRPSTYLCLPHCLGSTLNKLLKLGPAPEKLTVAGKNASGFDIPFLLSGDYGMSGFIRFDHRVLDVGSMFVEEEDEYIPGLRRCLERIGRQPSALHTALGDCMDVCYLVRKFFDRQRLSFTDN